MKNKIPLSIWLTILAWIISGVWAFATITARVDAMVSREQANKITFMQMVGTLNEVKEAVIRIECVVSPSTCI